MVLFGERIDGPRAAEIGLAWACYADDELLDAAVAFAARAAEVPKELAAMTIATLREAPWQPDFDAAVATEVGRQARSLGQGWFRT
jgi:enoyl-CoA hydratase